MAQLKRLPVALIALIAVASGASSVMAQTSKGTLTGSLLIQGGPGQGGPQRGPQGGPRGGMRMGPPHGPQLLLNPQVIKELKETDTQVQKIRELMKGQRGGPGQGGPGGPPPQGGGQDGDQGFGGPPPQGGPGGQGGPGQGGPGFDPEKGKQMESAIKKILNETQYKRYRQIDLQVDGPRAFQRPEVVEALQISEDQMDQIREIMEQNRPQGGPPQGGPGQGGRGQGDPGKFADELMKKITAVLSDSQKSKFKELVGAPFKLERPKGGPQGGPGQGGPGQGGPDGPPPGGGFDGGQG